MKLSYNSLMVAAKEIQSQVETYPDTPEFVHQTRLFGFCIFRVLGHGVADLVLLTLDINLANDLLTARHETNTIRHTFARSLVASFRSWASLMAEAPLLTSPFPFVTFAPLPNSSRGC